MCLNQARFFIKSHFRPKLISSFNSGSVFSTILHHHLWNWLLSTHQMQAVYLFRNLLSQCFPVLVLEDPLVYMFQMFLSSKTPDSNDQLITKLCKSLDPAPGSDQKLSSNPKFPESIFRFFTCIYSGSSPDHIQPTLSLSSAKILRNLS